MAYQVSKGHGYYYCLNKQCAEPYARADRLEEDVAGLYAYIALPDDIREAIEGQLDAAVTEQEGRRAGSLKRLTKQLTALTRQRKKLLKLYYADALDIKTFKSERERIDEETRAVEREMKQANASLGEERDVIRLAMDLLAVMDESYKRSNEATRRKFNLGFFEHVTVSEKQVTEAKLAEPFRSVQSVPTSGIRRRSGDNSKKVSLKQLRMLVRLITKEPQ